MRVLSSILYLSILIGPISGLAQSPQFQPFRASIKSEYWTETGVYSSSQVTFTRARDGSFAYEDDTEEMVEQGQALRGRFRYLLNVQRRLYIMTEPFVRGAVASPVNDQEEMQDSLALYGSCRHLEDAKWKEVGRSTLLGIDVIEVEVGRRRMWVSPEFQCFALRETIVVEGQLRKKNEVTSLVREEPPAGLFDLPAGYTAMSPLELERRYQERFPGRILYGKAVTLNEERYQRAVARAKARTR